MRKPWTRMFRIALVSLSLLSVLTVNPAIGCWYCKSSPDGRFGFCRPDAARGYNDCTDYVKDEFTGATSCKLEGNTCPYGVRAGGDDGGGGSDCWWPGLYGGCILYY